MDTIRHSSLSRDLLAVESARFMNRVYTWMTAGIVFTMLVGHALSGSPDIVFSLFQSTVLRWSLMLALVFCPAVLGGMISRLSAVAAGVGFFVYAGLVGVVMSTVFLVYTQESLLAVLGSTACAFGGLSIIGNTTKRDLGPIGAFCSMALFGMIGFWVLSLFFPQLMAGEGSMIYSAVGVLVFAGLTAYDTQKLKEMGYALTRGGREDAAKFAIYGALVLYLDFVNMFLSLLRLFGRRK